MSNLMSKQKYDEYTKRRDEEIEKFKAKFDIRDYFEGDPRIGKPVSTGTDYAMFRCPVHGGKSLVAYADSWKCFGDCDQGGDIFAWLKFYNNIEFPEALRELGVLDDLRREFGLPNESSRTVKRYVRKTHAPVHEPKLSIATPPSQEWQDRVRQIVDRAEVVLWSPEGQKYLDYLQSRGLLTASVLRARLGLIPGADGSFKTWNGLTIPHGITIPWFADGHLWGVKVRRFNVEDNKYMPIATHKKYIEAIGKGQHTKCLYGVDDVLAKWPMMLVEGEFDRIIVWQEASDLVCPVTAGSASNHINPRWYPHLACASMLLACYDDDDAGNKAQGSLKELTARARFIKPLIGKDPNEFHLKGGQLAVRHWIKNALEAA